MAKARKFFSKRKGLHIEAEGCVINIYEKIYDRQGREVTVVQIIPDKYSGERKWKLIGTNVVRVVRLKTVKC